MANKSKAKQILDLVHYQINNDFEILSQNFLQHADEIEQVNNLLSDDKSRKIYNQQLAHLVSRDYVPSVGEVFNPFPLKKYQQITAAAPQYFAQHQPPALEYSQKETNNILNMVLLETFFLNGYNYEDKVKVEPGDIYLDCGAFIGDTALWAYEQGAAQVYSFEPGQDILDDLRTNLAKYNRPVENVVPFAVSDINTHEKLRVMPNNNAGNNLLRTCRYAASLDLSKCELQDVATVRLDDWCAANNVEPTFIKMDIEGAELSALKGATEIIKKHKPKLAICLYHKFEDMWEIPLYIHSIVPEYKFYCKKNHNLFDFILFATV